MAITRQNVADYLHTQFSEPVAAIGQTTNNDSPAGYGPDIDNALRKLGKSESELATATVENSQREAFYALSEFYTAERVWTQLGSRVNTTTGNNEYDFKDMRKSVKERMEKAADRCAMLGYIVDGRKKSVLFQVY